MENLKAPKDIVHISGFESEVLKITDEDGSLVVTSTTHGRVEYENDTYRCLLVTNVKNCTIILKTKVLKILFIDVLESKITIGEASLGPIELYRCRELKVYIMKEIPFLYSEKVDNCDVYQTIEEQKYVLHFCYDFVCHVLNENRTQRVTYDFGKYFWNEQELDMYTVTRETGQTCLQLSLVLNEIKQFLLKNEELY